MKKFTKYEKYSIYVITIGFLIRIFITLFVYPSGDATWHINVARFIFETKTIPSIEPLVGGAFWPPPFFHILMAIAYGLFVFFGESSALLSAQMITPIFSAISLGISYLIIKQLSNEKIAFYSAIFLAFLPIHVYMSTLAYVDMTFMAMFLLSLYFTLKKKYSLGGIFAGLTMLTKYHGILLIFLNIYIVYVNKEKIKSYISSVLPATILGSSWYLRNFILFGNPIWPFMNSLFKGDAVLWEAYNHASISNFISFRPYISLLTETLGVPSGNIHSLSLVNFPYSGVIISLWLIGSFVYLVPVLLGLSSLKKHGKLFLLWFLLFASFGSLYIYDYGDLEFRFLLALLPIAAFAWAYGFKKIMQKKYSKTICVLLIILIICLASAELLKAHAASSRWDKFRTDFDWVKENTAKDARILFEGGQTLGFNFRREFVLYEKGIKQDKFDYVIFYPLITKDSPYDELFIEKIKTFPLVYRNNKTKVSLYSKSINSD